MTKTICDDNIKENENSLSSEYQRYGRNKSTTINHDYINSGEYRNKFDHITNNINVNRVLYLKAKEMLEHRSGTLIEDMYWIDGNTGEVVAKAVEQTEEIIERIEYTEAIKRAINGKKNLITLHTHPKSVPPSASDFNSTFVHKYMISLIICHDGRVIQYSSNQEVSEKLWFMYIEEFIDDGYNEFESQWLALEKLKENHDIDFLEVIS